MPEHRRQSIFSDPSSQFPRGARFLIGGLHVLLAAAIVVFIVRFLGVMERVGVSFGKIFYVPVGAGLLGAFILYRGVMWFRRGGDV
jgi:hypothetical protein